MVFVRAGVKKKQQKKTPLKYLKKHCFNLEPVFHKYYKIKIKYVNLVFFLSSSEGLGLVLVKMCLT